MEITDISESLRSAQQVPIAELGPDLSDTANKVVCGIVTVVYPYNSVNHTFSFILAEPDFRLRRNKGQVRINFSGPAAKAAGESGLGSNDEVRLSLQESQWEPEVSNRRQSLPGATIDWQLKISGKLILQMKSGETGQEKIIQGEASLPVEELQQPVQSPPTTTDTELDQPLPAFPAATPVKNAEASMLRDREFASPAFIKRARDSYGSLFEEGYDIFEADGGVKGKGRKRTKFGQYSNTWRYSSQSRSPSPEPAVEAPIDDSFSKENQASLPVSRPQMTDEGCQTMELDAPVPSPPFAKPTGVADEDHRSPGGLPKTVDSPKAMVDHGVQAFSQTSWQPAPPSNLPPFGAPAIFPNQEPSRNLFQPANDLPSISGSLHHEWPSTAVEHPRGTYPESPFSPHLHENLTSKDFSTPFAAEVTARRLSGSQARSPAGSPVRTGHVSLEEFGRELRYDAAEDEITHPGQDAGSATYPPVFVPGGLAEPPARDEAYEDYPVSYLDEAQQANKQASPSRSTLGQETQPAVDTVASSWDPMSHPFAATAAPRTERLGSMDAGTPEDPVVIDDDSDSDDGEASTPAVENAVVTGHAETLNIYEDAQAGGLSDAEYSDDDDNSDYDEDEMGGDYDNRNYLGPDDDEDDSHDEDLRPHPFEPEFEDDQFSDDEDIEDDEEFDDESDQYDENENADMDYERPRLPQQPSRQSAPEIIDLLSSSEDEDGEDDAHSPPPSYKDEMRAELASSKHEFDDMEEADDIENEKKGSENNNSDEEEYSADVEDHPDHLEVVSPVEEATEMDQDQASDPEHETERMVVESEEEGEQNLVEEEVNQSEMEQQHNSPQFYPITVAEEGSLSERFPSKLGQEAPASVTVEDENLGNSKESFESGNAGPQSAADGLEVLSRMIDNETISLEHPESPGRPLGSVTAEAFIVEDQMMTSHPTVEDLHRREEHQEVAEVQKQVHDVSGSSTFAPAQESISGEEVAKDTLVVPSPPLTHSFRSQVIRENVEVDRQDSPERQEPQEPAEQLPTPRDIQVIDPALSSGSADIVAMEVEETLEIRTYPNGEEENLEVLSTGETQTTKMNGSHAIIDETEERIGVPIDIEPAPDTISLQDSVVTTHEETTKSLLGSPSISFHTQVADDDMIGDEGAGETSHFISKSELEIGAEVTQEISVSASFRSQMELDEELQASILDGFEQFSDSARDPTDTPELPEEEAGPSQAQTTDGEQLDDVDMIDTKASEVDSAAPDGSSPILGTSAAKHPEPAVSVETEASDGDEDENPTQADPSIQLARASNGSKRSTRGEATPEITRPHTRSFDARNSSSPVVDDASIQLARAHVGRTRKSRDPTPEPSRLLTRSYDAYKSSSPAGADPSVQLARASVNKGRKSKEASPGHSPHTRSLSSPEAEDPSVQLARASMGKDPSEIEEDSAAITAAKLKLSRHLREKLPDCVSLKILRQHLTKSLDVFAIVMMQPPEPRRAKGGPREYMMSFTITDHSIGPFAVSEVQLYRPHKDSLPVVKPGDVVLLRNFKVLSLQNKGLGLRTTDASSWAVFDHNEGPPQIRGPPVEYGEAETAYVEYLQEWFSLLGEKSHEKLERATKKIVEASGKGGSNNK
ncbi:hypothetical protein F4778DRAFT_712372 [Xylariomycetidae sp. FL2044]|nr:hypothetical protein F4778DRAFT_712372 [Xylariomycetidae sp. FL2044]